MNRHVRRVMKQGDDIKAMFLNLLVLAELRFIIKLPFSDADFHPIKF